MKTGAIEKVIGLLECTDSIKQGFKIRTEQHEFYGPGFDELAEAARAEFATLKKENAELKNRAEVVDNRLGDFLDEYNQNPHHDGKRLARLAQAILNVLQKRYQYGDCGKAYKETIKELNQYLAEENTRTVAELGPLARTLLGLKDSPGLVPPSMYRRS